MDWSDVRPPLTDAQREALDPDRAIAVAAGAGSGKTHVLAMRYVGALLDVAGADAMRGKSRSPLPSVLVLTFTEKAADEMRERCRARLGELIEAVRTSDLPDGIGDRVARSLTLAADGFTGARISTFHGLCARILRELPVASGASPRFSVLDTAAAAERRLAAASAALDALAAEPGPALGLLLQSFHSRARILEAVSSLMADRHRLAGPIAAHAEGRITAADVVAASPVPIEDVRRWLRATGAPMLARLASLLSAAPEDEGLLSRIRGLLARLDAVVDAPVAPSPAAALAELALYRDTIAALLTADHGKVRKLTHFTSMGRKGRWADPVAYVEARKTLEILEAEAPAWAAEAKRAATTPNEADARMLEVLRPLCAVTSRAIAAYRAELDEDAALDFTELEVRAAAALEKPGSSALRERFQHVLVDELQDTDATQWRLVQRLLARPSGLFAVGDKKQAIYRFRGGDVTVFDAAVGAVGRAVDLADNFRTRRTLIDWMNGLFQRVLGAPGPERPAWEAHHEPLRAWRPDPGGSVAILANAAGDSAATERDADARSLADWIADRVLGGQGPYAGFDLGDRARWPSPPIAILLRTRARLGLYLQALRARGVPATVARGVGFWQRREITDVVVLLRAITAVDPVATVGWLRSPLGGVADVTLDRVVLDRGPEIWASLDDDRLEPARSRWAVLRAAARVQPPAEALATALVTCRAAETWRRSGIDDAEANIARLVERVAALADSGEDLPAIAAHLWRQVLDEEPESEAVVVPGAARVVLLTVHASKGLEFPVVVVPELDARTDGRPGPIAARHRPGPVALSLASPAPGAGRFRAPERGGTWARLEAERADEEAAESRRLFYVALTRARDHLILAGRIRPRASETRRPTWMDHLVEAHPEITGLPADAVLLADGVTTIRLPEPRRIEPLPPEPREEAAALPPPSPLPVAEIDASLADVACPARLSLSHRLGPRPGAIGPLRAAWVRGRADDVPADAWKRLARWDREPRRRSFDRLDVRAPIGGAPVRATLDRLEEHRDGWMLTGFGAGSRRLSLEAAVAGAALGIAVTRARTVDADGAIRDVPLETPILPQVLPWDAALAAAAATRPPCAECPFHRRPCPGVA